MDHDKAETVLREMESGKSLRKSCIAADLPLRTFLDWCKRNPELDAQYARARQILLQVRANEIIDIVDDVDTSDPTTASANVAKARVQADMRRWELSKLLPKVYGDKVEVEHSGEVRSVKRVQIDVSGMPEDQQRVLEHLSRGPTKQIESRVVRDDGGEREHDA